MTLNIKLKRSGAKDSAPTAGQLEDGELGLNYNKESLALYCKDTDGAIRQIAGQGSEGLYWDLSGSTLSPDSNTYNVAIGGSKITLNSDGSASFGGNVDILENTRVRGRLNVGTNNAGGMGDGVIIAGDQSASNGQVMLAGRYTGADSVPLIGSMYGSGNALIGYGVRCSTTASNTFLSTAGNANWKRAALEVGGELKYKNAGPQNTAVGSEVTMTERFRVDQNGNVQIGGTIPSSPNIELKSNGQAEYKSGQFNIATYKRTAAGGGIQISLENGNGATRTLANDSAGHLFFGYAGTNQAALTNSGSFQVGGTLTSAPNIELNANGSAEFSGQIETKSGGIKFPDGTVQTSAAGGPGNANTLQEVTDAGNFTTEDILIGGVEASPNIFLRNEGSIELKTSNSSQRIFTGYTNSTITSFIRAGGEAYYAGPVGIGTSDLPATDLEIRSSDEPAITITKTGNGQAVFERWAPGLGIYSLSGGSNANRNISFFAGADTDSAVEIVKINADSQVDIGTDYVNNPYLQSPNIVLNTTTDTNTYPLGSSTFRNDAVSFTEGDQDSFNDGTAIIARNADQANVVSGSFMRFDTIGTAGYQSNWWVGAKQEVGNSTNDDTNGSSFKISQLTRNRNGEVTDRLVIERDGDVLIGGTLPSAPNLTLKSTGSVISGGDPSAAANNGAEINPVGLFRASRSNDTDNLWIGYTTGNTNPTSEIFADGSATFVAPIASGINATTVTDLAQYEFLTTSSQVSDGSGVVMALGHDGRGRAYISSQHEDNNKDHQRLSFYTTRNAVSTETLRLTGEGNAEFPGTVNVEGTLISRGTTLGAIVFAGRDPSAQNTSLIFEDGSAEFDGQIETKSGGIKFPDGSVQTTAATGGGGGGGTGAGADAWAVVNTAGQPTTSGTVYTLDQSLNIAEVKKGSATGTYEVTFTTPMPANRYSVVATGSAVNGSSMVVNTADQTATGFIIKSYGNSGLANVNNFCFTVHARNALPPTGGTGADHWCTVAGDGFNVESVTQSTGPNANNFVVRFTTPMPSTKYAVVATPTTNADGFCFIRDKTVNGYTVVTRKSDGSAAALSWSAVVHATNATLPDTFTESQIQSVVDLAQTGNFSGQLSAAQLVTTGFIQSGGNAYGGVANGFKANPDGYASLSRDNDASSALLIYTTGDSTPKTVLTAGGSARFEGSVRASNITFYLTPDDPDSWDVIEETYTETETYEIEVPVIKKPGVGTADLVEDPATADIEERETRTVTRTREVEKTREVREYVGPTMDVKDTLLKITTALTGLKAAAESASTCDELKAAINTALADI